MNPGATIALEVKRRARVRFGVIETDAAGVESESTGAIIVVVVAAVATIELPGGATLVLLLPPRDGEGLSATGAEARESAEAGRARESKAPPSSAATAVAAGAAPPRGVLEFERTASATRTRAATRLVSTSCTCSLNAAAR